MNRRIVSFLIFLLLASTVLFAVPVAVTWEWAVDDPHVTTFRYQMDGEDPGKWIVVDASQTSYTVEGLDGSKSYSLYLQQSYDGVNFSTSAVAMTEPLESAASETSTQKVEQPQGTSDVVSAPAENTAPTQADAQTAIVGGLKEPMPESTSVATAANESAPVEEPPAPEPAAEEPASAAESQPKATVAEPVVVAKKPIDSVNTFNVTAGVFVGANYTLSDILVNTQKWNAVAGLDLGFNNIVGFGKASGMGLSIQGAYEPNVVASYATVFEPPFWQSIKHQVSASAYLDYDLSFKSAMVRFGVGAFAVYPFDLSFVIDNLDYGASAHLGAFFPFNKSLYGGFDVNYRYDLGPVVKKNAQTLGATLSIGVRF
jgi:hypothetical protein